MSYATQAARTLALITRKGAPVTFVGGNPGTPATYDDATDTTTGGSPATDLIGSAVQVESNPDKLAGLGLLLETTATLLVAASGLAVPPQVNGVLRWGGQTYTIADKQTTAPDGATPILYTLIAKAA